MDISETSGDFLKHLKVYLKPDKISVAYLGGLYLGLFLFIVLIKLSHARLYISCIMSKHIPVSVAWVWENIHTGTHTKHEFVLVQ